MDLRMLCVLLPALVVVMATKNLNPHDDVMTRDVIPGVGDYYFIDQPMNWTEAFLWCQAASSHLAVIDSAAEAAAIRQLIADNNAPSVHLGFHDQFLEGNYIDVLGDAMNVGCRGGNEWAAGFPTGNAASNCGAFSDDGLSDINCGEILPFICEIPMSPEDTTLVGYKKIPTFGYFKAFETNATWPEADDICRQDGGYLWISDSPAEFSAVIGSHIMKDGFIYSVGIHRIHGGNNNFMSVKGGPFDQRNYQQWYFSQPEGGFVTNPYVSWINNRSGVPSGLYTRKGNYYFVCEVDL